MAPCRSPSTVSCRIAAWSSTSCCCRSATMAPPANNKAAKTEPARLIDVRSMSTIYRTNVTGLCVACAVSVLSSWLQSIADPAHAHDVARMGGVGLNQPAQLHYMRVDDAIGYENIAAPHRVDHLCSGNYTGRILKKKFEHLHLDCREVRVHSAAAQLGAAEIDFAFTDAPDGFHIGRRAAQ